jgi:hypothetical protein
VLDWLSSCGVYDIQHFLCTSPGNQISYDQALDVCGSSTLRRFTVPPAVSKSETPKEPAEVVASVLIEGMYKRLAQRQRDLERGQPAGENPSGMKAVGAMSKSAMRNASNTSRLVLAIERAGWVPNTN